MQFIANGPDLPVEILRAQEEGRLALFCGTGISIPAGLPSFQGLADQVCGSLAPELNRREAFGKDEALDRVFGLLDRRFGGAQVRQEVRRILATPERPVLTTHEALIDLATGRNGQTRLVTTNFDLLFESARAELRWTAAPLLPVPKRHKWDQLVYLHGRLGDEDPDGLHLVLSASDFGVAYLVERWASRFVSELFRHHTVLFVGYSVDDPVMRYLVDAVAAERQRGDALQRAYALAPCQPGNEEAEKESWQNRGIDPVLFDPADDYTLLHRTLAAWARAWAGGLASRRAVVTDLAVRNPDALPEEERSQLCWALDDESGATAQVLSELGTSAPIGWLPVLEESGLLSAAAAAEASKNDLVAASPGSLPPTLDAVRWDIARWLIEHLDTVELAHWVLRAGGHLHPELRWSVNRALRDDRIIRPALRKLWSALSGGVRLAADINVYEQLDVSEGLGSVGWSPSVRVEVLRALEPQLRLRRALWIDLPGEETEEADDLYISRIASPECELAAGDKAPQLISTLRNREDWQSELADLAFDLTALLRSALDQFAALDAASEDHDPAIVQHPSIAPHEQNHDFHGWTQLIDLVRDAFKALREIDPERAGALVTSWLAIPYPVFRALTLHAARNSDALAPELVLDQVVSDPKLWLWSLGAQVELYRSLRWAWEGSGQEARDCLVDAILAGPPRSMFRDDLEAPEWASVRDRSRWERLQRLPAIEALPPRARHEVERIEATYPDWELRDHEGRDFPYWSETSWGRPTDYSAGDLAALSNEELVRTLIEHEDNREGLLDAWRDVATEDRGRTADILEIFENREYWDPEVWARGISTFREIEEPELGERLVALLRRWTYGGALHQSIPREIADAIRALCDALPHELHAPVLALWDDVFPDSLAVQEMDTDRLVTAAINHPVGVLAEALLCSLQVRSLERGSGIPGDLEGRFERLLDAQASTARLGRLLVASRLPWIHDIDPDWAFAHVVPLLAWTNPVEAAAAWQGFLRSAYVRPSLWEAIKPAFVDAFEHLESLGSEATRSLATLLASFGIEADDGLNPAKCSRALKQLDDEGRETVLRWIERKLSAAEEQAAVLWRTRVHPWIDSCWPREPVYQSPGTASEFAAIAIRTGEAFPESAIEIVRFVVPIDRAHSLLEDMNTMGRVRSYPLECLALADAFTPASPPGYFGRLGAFLRILEQASPGISRNAQFTRLREIALQARL